MHWSVAATQAKLLSSVSTVQLQCWTHARVRHCHLRTMLTVTERQGVAAAAAAAASASTGLKPSMCYYLNTSITCKGGAMTTTNTTTTAATWGSSRCRPRCKKFQRDTPGRAWKCHAPGARVVSGPAAAGAWSFSAAAHAVTVARPPGGAGGRPRVGNTRCSQAREHDRWVASVMALQKACSSTTAAAGTAAPVRQHIAVKFELYHHATLNQAYLADSAQGGMR